MDVQETSSQSSSTTTLSVVTNFAMTPVNDTGHTSAANRSYNDSDEVDDLLKWTNQWHNLQHTQQAIRGFLFTCPASFARQVSPGG